ncbi:MAG: STAS-like domain-containing protein [Chthoniobacterales bacterium]|nr:STAS-like domain-containing protein [Chthoniobacterales bacterium]
MKLELPIAADLGTHLADGAAAAEYRRGRIDPYVGLCDEIVLNFTGVRTANSSFVNGLIVGLIEQHSVTVLKRVTFKGCNPVMQVLVQAAVDLGLAKIDGRVDA